MAELSMTAIALAFLGSDISAQRLAISWPRVAAASSEDEGVGRTARWAQLAGVPVIVAEKTGTVLLEHRLLQEDGTIACRQNASESWGQNTKLCCELWR